LISSLRNFDCDKSEKGKDINTTVPLEGIAMLHPPLYDFNLLQELHHLIVPLHSQVMVFQPVSLLMPYWMMAILLVQTNYRVLFYQLLL